MRPKPPLLVPLVLSALLGTVATWWWSDARPVSPPGAASAAGAERSGRDPSALPAPAAFVDEAACAGCHPSEASAWQESDHRLAMQEANATSVLGDFADARFQDQSTDTRFTRSAAGFSVETEGVDGVRASFDVPYVFGHDPLQQVLLPLPRGRLQALSVAWDRKSARWFSLYPLEHIDAHDPLHWTRPAQNWNFACAECHATDLKRNYDAESDTYRTTWNRLDVGCQACHGPGGRHVEWALGPNRSSGAPRSQQMAAGLGFDAPLASADSTREIEACARCHARRAPLGDGFDHRNRLMDDYLPALLEEGLYFADGQIQDEVYEYGSFLQSKMHAHGVRCSDCHEPHSLRLRQPGNALCATCHSPAPNVPERVDSRELVRKNYDTPEHHHHASGTPGSACVDCHMPTRTYMVVDPRRDHGFRVPRPDLAPETGAPDPCSACHAEGGAPWAAARIDEWSREGSGPKKRPVHFGVALQAGRTGRNGAADALLALVRSDAPAIVRATALELLQRYPSREALGAAVAGLAERDGLVRRAALGNLESLPLKERVPFVAPLLEDPLRAVRAEAARLLVPLDAEALGPLAESARLALAEYEAIQRALLERPEARLNLAQLESELGRSAEAEAELRAALRLDPSFVPAYANLADLVRGSKGEPEAEGVLRDGLERVSESAPLLFALGLGLVRQKRTVEGLAMLARAAELAPEGARFGYVYAVALHDTGEPEAARTELARVLARHPEDRDARFALAAYLEEAGDSPAARRCMAELAAINPHDPGLENAVAPDDGRR